MPYRWLADLDLEHLRDASLYYDAAVDRYQVSGYRLDGERLDVAYDGEIFRRKFCQPMLAEKRS